MNTDDVQQLAAALQRAPTRADLRHAIDHAIDYQDARITDAYWLFTRTARARPPNLAVPDAYAERKRLWELRDLLRATARGRS